MDSSAEQTRNARALLPPDDHEISVDVVVQRILRAVREHLDLEVAFVGQFVDGERVFRYVDSAVGIDVVVPGDSDPREETYCHHVVAGALPGYLPDPATHAVTAALPATTAVPVGSHLSVPIRFSDGRIYGTFCCFAREVQPSLDPRDLIALEMMAELTAEYLEAIDTAQAEARRRAEVIGAVLDDPDGMTMVFQPLRDLRTMTVVGLEALARFPGSPHGPEWFFSEAARAGLGVELEMRAVRLALRSLDAIPEPIRLNVNVSPTTLYSGDFFDAVTAVPGDRLMVEVTEHAAIDDYAELERASSRLTAMGVSLAIDDVGMGFSGLNRILRSSPAELKLDAIVIRGVEANPVKQALVQAFCSFGERVGLSIVAEGIETEAELDALRSLGVRIGQGYHLGRPGPLPVAIGADSRAV